MILPGQDNGFPPGYFIIRSDATNRLLDVHDDDVRDGAHLILWPEKETSLVQGLRSPTADNQIFFIDGTGALCSKHSGHAIDIQGQTLVLRHRRPITNPAPNVHLPRFTYNPKNGQITATVPNNTVPSDVLIPVELETSPSIPHSTTYIIHSVPRRAPPSFLTSASSFLGTSMPFLSLGAQSTPEEVFDSGDIDLKEDEVEDEDKGEESEVDDSLDLGRDVKASLYKAKLESVQSGLGDHARMRRTWEVVPLRRANARWASS